jgi:CheY-like chemotaxis protein
MTEYGSNKAKITALPSPPGEENSPNDVANNLQNIQVSPNGSIPRPRILLVEDNAINLALLEKIVARTKPEILDTATNGQEAVNSVRAMSRGYQYIFMDISMPIMDGFEATQIIRSIERTRQAQIPAKIIALTGLGSDEHIARAYEAGVNLFLTKPISFKEILRLLSEDEHRRAAVPGG